MSFYTVNKYGIPIHLPGNSGTKPEQAIEAVLKDINCEYQMGFAFDEPGLRKKKFDAAVFKPNHSIAFLIEYDGEGHYNQEFFKNMGTRECRSIVHVTRTHLMDAEKNRIAVSKGIPLLRLNKLYKDCFRNVILSWVWTFVDEMSDSNQEINMVRMLDKYGWNFEYSEPSSPSKAVQDFLDIRNGKQPVNDNMQKSIDKSNYNKMRIRDLDWSILNSVIRGYRAGLWDIPYLNDPNLTVADKCTWIQSFNHCESKIFTINDWKHAGEKKRQQTILPMETIESLLKEMQAVQPL